MSLITGQSGGQGEGTSAGNGNQINDWRTSLPEDLRNEKVFESIKGKDLAEAFPVLAKNYVHAQKLVGAEKLVIPGETATPEERAAFYNKLGRPEKPDGYQIKLPEGLTEDRVDKAKIDLWRKEMHESGIPKAAAERLLNKYLTEEFTATQAAAQAHAKALQDGELALKQEFGTQYDTKLNFARFAVKEFGSDGLVQILESTGLGSNPEVVKLFANIGQKLSDDKARGSGTGQTGMSSFASPELAQHALNEFQRNPENMKALFDRQHPNHDRVVEDRAKLFAAAYPKEMQN